MNLGIVFTFLSILFYVYGCCACMYVFAPHVCSVLKGQKRVSDPLELELELVVSHQMDAGFPLNEQPVLLD